MILSRTTPAGYYDIPPSESDVSLQSTFMFVAGSVCVLYFIWKCRCCVFVYHENDLICSSVDSLKFSPGSREGLCYTCVDIVSSRVTECCENCCGFAWVDRCFHMTSIP